MKTLRESQKRIAVATACGWKIVAPGRGFTPDGEPGGIVPDYANDLNAMASAVDSLTDDQRVKFRLRLMYLSDGPKAQYSTVEAALCHATAAQRFEAFGKALGLW